MQEQLLAIDRLSVSFQQEKAVSDISFSIKKGEVLAVVGESGSGKSVTSLSILQLLPIKASIRGSILFKDENKNINLVALSAKGLQQIRGNKISMVFQEPMSSLNPVKNCGSQVLEAILLHKKINKQAAKQAVIELFQQVQLPNPGNIFYRYPHEISGGQKQRVMIAMAMCCQPQLLICDEPTTALDVMVQKEILLLIKQLQLTNNMSVLFISHDINLVAEIADRVAIFYKGEIVEIAAKENIFTSPKHPYTKALINCRPGLYKKGERLPVVSDFLNNSNKPQEDIINKEGNKCSGNKDSGNKDKVLLSIKNLNTWFPARRSFLGKTLQYHKAVNNVSFDIYEGENMGLVGGSGCGKTTLGRSILQLVKPVSGAIFYKGENILLKNNRQMRKLSTDIQMIFQDPYASLNPKLRIGQAIGEPLKTQQLYPEKFIKNKVIEWLEKVGLNEKYYYRYPHEFSGGQRQRIVIARALIMQPSFVICDECVSALDVSVQAQILNLLNDLKAELNFTSIFISHDLSVIKYFCDRIVVMNNGQIEEIGKAQDVYRHPEKDYTKKLLAALPNL